MARSWNSTVMLLLGGAVCVAVGAMMGASWSLGARAGVGQDRTLWREPAGSQGAETSPPTLLASVPSFRTAVEIVAPAIVTVCAWLRPEPQAEPQATEVTNEFAMAAYAEQPGRRNGSGFVINENGLIVTSRHVVAGAESIEVIVPQHGRRRADLVGEDRATDLALLRLVDPPAGLPVLVIGHSEDLRAGDWIVTVGNPYGFSRTVTAGVVSFVGRHLQHSDSGVTSDFLQISAAVNPGSSGCPVVDALGNVVGVTTQVAVAAQGISFAVPSRSVKWALEAMSRQRDGRVRRGYLGIEFASRAGFDEAGEPWPGAVIVNVAAGKPADRAGLRAGDVVLGVDGAPVLDARQLHERIVCSDPGTPLALQLLRDGQIRAPIVAVLGDAAADRSVDRQGGTPN